MFPGENRGWQAHIDIPWNEGRAEADLPGSTDDEPPVWSNIGLGSGRLTVPAGPEPTPVNRRMDRSARSLMRESLLYLGGALTILWGIAHLYPTKKVVHSFGRITRDNQLILTMEWIAEAILLIFGGVLVVVMTARFGAGDAATQTTATATAAMLLVLSAVSAATGGRVDFIMYRLCTPIFALSATLILVGAFA